MSKSEEDLITMTEDEFFNHCKDVLEDVVQIINSSSMDERPKSNVASYFRDILSAIRGPDSNELQVEKRRSTGCIRALLGMTPKSGLDIYYPSRQYSSTAYQTLLDFEQQYYKGTVYDLQHGEHAHFFDHIRRARAALDMFYPERTIDKLKAEQLRDYLDKE